MRKTAAWDEPRGADSITLPAIARARLRPFVTHSPRAGSDMSMDPIRYAAAACQTDLTNPVDRAHMAGNTTRMLAMIDAAVAGALPFLPLRPVRFSDVRHRGT